MREKLRLPNFFPILFGVSNQSLGIGVPQNISARNFILLISGRLIKNIDLEDNIVPIVRFYKGGKLSLIRKVGLNFESSRKTA